MKSQRPDTRLGLGSDMRAETYEQRATKPARNRVKSKPVMTTKPPANQPGRRTKR